MFKLTRLVLFAFAAFCIAVAVAAAADSRHDAHSGSNDVKKPSHSRFTHYKSGGQVLDRQMMNVILEAHDFEFQDAGDGEDESSTDESANQQETTQDKQVASNGEQQYRRGPTVDIEGVPGKLIPCPPGIPGLKPDAKCYQGDGGAIMVPEEDHIDGGNGEASNGAEEGAEEGEQQRNKRTSAKTKAKAKAKAKAKPAAAARTAGRKRVNAGRKRVRKPAPRPKERRGL
jgi:hypothetical protein